MNIRKEKYKS